MFSSHWPACLAIAFKAITLAAGVAAAGAAWWAAHLWLDASKVPIVDTTPRTHVSYDDNPGLGIGDALVACYAVQDAYNKSAELNAHAARWTAWAAILAGAGTVLGVL